MSKLPKGWTVEPFSRVASYTTGRTPARANPAYWKTGELQVPWVAISDMEQYGTIFETAESVSALAFESVFRERIVPAGTLIMSFKLTIGRVATLGIPACHNEAIISIFPREGVDQRYLGYFLSQVDYTDHQDRQIKGNTLNQSKIDQIQVALPLFKEQTRIADVLDKCRLGINIERAAQKTAEELKRAAMHELFTRGLRGEAQKETEIGLVPESWAAVSIADLGEVVTGTTPPTRNRAYYDDGDIPFISPGDIEHGTAIISTQKCITDSGLAVSRALPVGTTCVVCIGSTIGKVGRTTAAASATNQQINAIVPGLGCHPNYLSHLLTYQSNIVRNAASPSPVPILSKGAFEKLVLFTSTNPDEQVEIATILDAVDRKIDLHQKKRKVLEELFESLLHKLMTGEIAVSDLDLSALSPALTQPEEAAA